jgi:TetR/AcrR family transcriptional regulator
MKACMETPDPFAPFSRLDPPKQRQIIEASLDEFLEHGFRGASTNRIVQKLGIAKGSLFHYFGSKERLYLFLLYRAGMEMLQLLESRYSGMPDDLCERLQKVVETTLEFAESRPRLYRFLAQFADSGLTQLQQRYAAMFSPEQRQTIFYDLFQGVDTSRLRGDPAQAFLLVRWLIAGLKQDLLAELTARGEISQLRASLTGRLEVVLEALRHGIYRRTAENSGGERVQERSTSHGGR